jgi:hypothetical protein
MVETLFFFFALFGVLMVIHWAATNDKAGNRGATTGFLAMREPESLAERAQIQQPARAAGTYVPKAHPARPHRAV